MTHTNNSNSQTWPWYHPPPTNQQPSPLPPFVGSFAMQQLLGSQANIMPCCGAPMQQFYSSPICVGPVYQGMAQQHQHQHQHRPPNSGPSRNQHSKGRRKTEAQYSYHTLHESSGTIAGDHSTGIHPGMASMGAVSNTGAGGAWRPPSGNTSTVDRNSTQQTRITPYERDRSGHCRTRRQRSDKVNPSAYEIHIGDSESRLISQSILYRLLHRQLFSGGATPGVIPAPAPSMLSTSAPALSPSALPTSTSALANSTPTASTGYAETTTYANAQERMYLS